MDQETPPPPAAEPPRAVRSFRRFALILAGAVGVLLLVAALTAWGMYASATASVAQYDAAVAIDAQRAEAERLELESRLAALYSETQSRPEWSTTVTADQVNGWLATRLPAEFPGFARSGLSEPRVWIDEQNVTVAVRADIGRIDGVLTVTTRPTVTDAGELLLEIVSARMGRLGLPIAGVVAQARRSPLEKVAPVRWSQTESQTAVIVDPQRIDSPAGKTIRLVGVDLRPGELLLRGESVGVEAAVEPAP